MPNSSPAKKRKPPVTHPVKHVAQVIFECGGITKDAARKLKMTEATVRSYVKKYASCREAREEALIDLKSIATDTLIEMVRKKDRQYTLFVLSRVRLPDGTWVTKKEAVGDSEGSEEPITIG